VKKDLKLSDRSYKCDCGLIIDRDLNASINLKNAKEYKIA
ncbi:transposase, partial [Bifidobacterium longum]